MNTTSFVVSSLATTAVAAGFDFSPLYAYGPLGVMCAWLMWKGDSRLRAVEINVITSLREHSSAIDRATKAHMLLVISIPNVSDAIKSQAREVVADVDEATRKREGK